MNLKKLVKDIQTMGYNGARMVIHYVQRDRTPILSFLGAGLAALHKARYNIMKVVQS